jgi:hypothetical protein
MKRLAWILLGATVVIVAVVVLAAALLGDDSQTNVVAKKGDTLPSPTSLNRSDDAGADTVRAYLQGALACSASGERLMQDLSRAGERTVRAVFESRCARNGDRPWTDSISGKLDPDELDAKGRALWAVSAGGGGLPQKFHVRIQMTGGSWKIERACSAVCAD